MEEQIGENANASISLPVAMPGRTRRGPIHGPRIGPRVLALAKASVSSAILCGLFITAGLKALGQSPVGEQPLEEPSTKASPADAKNENVPEREGVETTPPQALMTLDEIVPLPAGSPAATSQPELSERGARALEKADEYLRERRYTDAILELDKARRYDPQHFKIHQKLAAACLAAGNQGRALTHADEALRYHADDPVCHYVLGRSELKLERLPSALLHFRQAVEAGNADRDPRYAALSRYHLANTLQRMDYWSAAVEQYRLLRAELAELTPREGDPDELRDLLNLSRRVIPIQTAQLLQRLGRLEEAADVLEAPASTLEDPELLETYVRILTKTGRWEKALDAVRRLFDQNPDSAPLVVETYQAAGRGADIAAALREAVEAHADDDRYVLALADAWVKLERGAEAESLLRESLQRRPGAVQVAWRLADLLAAQKRWTDLLDLMADTIAASPSTQLEVRNRLLEVLKTPEDAESVSNLDDAPGPDEKNRYARDYLMGCVAERAGRQDRAMELYRRSIASAADFYAPYTALGTIHLNRWRWDDAIATGAAAVEAGADHTTIQWIIGQGYEGLDRNDEAIAHYNQAVRLNRENVPALLSLADLYARTDQTNRAEREYDAVLQLNPTNVKAREALFHLFLFTIRDAQEAANQIEKLRTHGAPRSTIARCEALHALANDPAGNSEKFERTLTASLAEFPNDAETRFQLAGSFYGRGELQKAEAELDRILQADPRDENALELSYWLRRKTLDFQGAEEQVRALLERHPNRGRWRQMLVSILTIRQDYTAAIERLDAYLRGDVLTDVERIRFRYDLVLCCFLQGNLKEAIERVDSWLGAEPDNADLWTRRVRLLLLAGRNDEAVEQAVSRYEKNPAGQAEQADVLGALLFTRRFEQAGWYVLSWIEKDPENEALNSDLWQVLQRWGRHDDAVEWVQNNLESGRFKLAYQNLLIRSYQIAERYDDALRALSALAGDLRNDRTAEIDPENLNSLEAMILIEAERFDRAKGKLSRWIDDASNPLLKTAYLRLLSACYQQTGKTEQACQQLEQVLRLIPNDSGTCNDLGYTYADAGVQLERAETLIRKAVGDAPQRAAYLDSLGWVLYKQGRFDEAVLWLDRACHAPVFDWYDWLSQHFSWYDWLDRSGHERGGDDPTVVDHLADAKWQAGQRDEAKELWTRAVELAERRSSEKPSREDKKAATHARRKLDEVREGKAPSVADVPAIAVDDQKTSIP